ncbi:hypothetical protein I7I48_08298 [Histoplasma ohiense]|nr:hypothetical protein I7I48_08298 [Histoplasma ohiense (nom. inval.)]
MGSILPILTYIFFITENIQTRAGHWNLREEVERTSRSGSSSSSSSSSSSRGSRESGRDERERIVSICLDCNSHTLHFLTVCSSLLDLFGQILHCLQHWPLD